MIKEKKCKDCKEVFQPFKQMQPRCVPCAIAKGKVDAHRQYERDTERQKKKIRKDITERKKALKPKNTILSEAQAAFNAYVRYRDKDLPCINEGVMVDWNGNESDAAHFVSRAANGAMRFDLRNVNKSTKKSNANQEKWIHEYRANLIIKLGKDRFEQFESDCKYWKINKRNFNKEYLERIKRIFRKKKRVLMKIRGD